MLGILAGLQAQAVDRYQLLPGAAPDVDRLQQGRGRHARLGIFQQLPQDLDARRMVGLTLQDLAQILEGAVAVGQLDALDARQSETQLDVVLSAQVPFQPAFEQVHQIIPAAQLNVESIQRRHRVRIARQQRPDPLPCDDGLFFPCQANRQAASLAPQNHFRPGRVGQVRPPQNDFVERAQILLLAVDSFQGRQRRVVVRPPLGNAAVVVNGQRQVAETQGVLGDSPLQAQARLLGQNVRLHRAIEIDDLDCILISGRQRETFVVVEQPAQVGI